MQLLTVFLLLASSCLGATAERHSSNFYEDAEGMDMEEFDQQQEPSSSLYYNDNEAVFYKDDQENDFISADEQANFEEEEEAEYEESDDDAQFERTAKASNMISIQEFQSGKAKEIDQPALAFQALYRGKNGDGSASFEDDEEEEENGAFDSDEEKEDNASSSFDNVDNSNSDDDLAFEGDDPSDDSDFEDDEEAAAEEEADSKSSKPAADTSAASKSSKSAAAPAPTPAVAAAPVVPAGTVPTAAQVQAQVTQNVKNSISKFFAGSTGTIGNATMNSDGTIKTTPYTTGAAIVLIVIGVFMLVFGQRAFKVIMFIFGFLFFGAVGYFVLTYLKVNNIVNVSSNTTWIYVGVVAGSGLIGGGLFVCCVNIASFLFGAALGAIIAVFFNTLPFVVTLNTNVRIGIIAGWILLGIIFGYFVRKPLLILMTSFVGSYSMFCGIDFFIKSGFYSLLYKLRTGQASLIPWGLKLYLMAGGFLLVAIIAAVVQFRQDKKDRETKYQPAPTKQV